MEEPHLIRQLFDVEPAPRRTLGERRGFGDVPWGRLDLIVVSVVGLFAQVVLMPIGYVGAAHLASADGGTGAVSFFAGAVASYAVLLGAVWFFGLRRHHASAESLGFRPVDVRGLLGLLGVFALTVAAANLILGSVTALPRTQELLDFGQRPVDVVLLALLVVVAAPLAEETFFRGFLLQGLVRRFTFWPAAVVTSAVFCPGPRLVAALRSHLRTRPGLRLVVLAHGLAMGLHRRARHDQRDIAVRRPDLG